MKNGLDLLTCSKVLINEIILINKLEPRVVDILHHTGAIGC